MLDDLFHSGRWRRGNTPFLMVPESRRFPAAGILPASV
jgi:hypothetical protein